MIRRPIDDIEEADLAMLVTSNVAEGRSLEFKRDLPGTSDADVKEFLADVTSLANAQGGDAVFGIEEKNGAASRLAGLSLQDADAAILRLENILRDGIEPRLAGVRIRWIQLRSGNGVIVLRAPASLRSPHRVRFKNSGRFYSRNSRGKYEMDTHELRQAFNESEEFPSKLRAFHHRAVLNSKGEEFPFRLANDPGVILSIVPISILRDPQDVPVTPETAVVPSRISGALSYLHTLEGVLFRTPLNIDNSVRSYALTHRHGRVDAGWIIGGERELQPSKVQKMVFGQYFRNGIIDLCTASVARLRSFAIEGPWLAFATVLRIHGSRLGIGDYDLSDAAWQDEVTFPEIIADDLNKETLRPMFEAFPLIFGVPPAEYHYPA